MTDNTQRPIAPSGFQPNLRVIPGTNGGGDVAEYIQPERSGLESGFYVEDRGLPWHVTLARRLNTPELMIGSQRKLTAGEAIELMQVGWEVDKAPAYAMINGQMKELPGRYVTYRKDTGAILSPNTVSASFKVVQQRDAFAFADHIIDIGGAHCESGGSLFGGRQVFLSMELPAGISVEGDPSDYRMFLLISNGHDGDHPLRVDITVERALCRNTLRIAQKRAISSWSIRHTSGIDGRVQEAREALGLSFTYAESFGESASALVKTKLVDRQVDEILARLLPLTESQQERVDKAPEKLELMPVGIARMIYRESPTVEPIRGTAYGLLSAITEYADHFTKVRAGAGGEAEDVRADRLAFSQNSAQQELKQKAWDLLTAASDPKQKAKVK